ncbi:uroporphyrinogen-III synthase [Mesorhizobium sp. LHD-90]|uniref:uroporphyrinogen-III synthase n=1 Tax=Mesorhizobium sp. LHD-90 TaxID=3071414 RepID=UPI0027DFABEF|nr:uroporphyrinogen-III synthase [Mesorhizobium sp. LHD-90]MDQ6437782.1 uroporphyrinogen-III synthase [Mesorhizobium sp. LHD-90]
MVTVLVTRPQPGAVRTARRLAEMGHRPVELPLTRTTALPGPPASLDGPVDAVAVTSANALRHAPPALLARLAERPCFAVGERTAATAREHGFRSVTAANGDANSLADLISSNLRPGSTIAYLTGRIRLSDLEAQAAAAGLNLVAVETYDTQAIDYRPQDLAERLGTEPIDAVLLYSANAAERLLRLRWPESFGDWMSQATCLCMSQRVAERLPRGAVARILVAPEPSEPALLALLAEPSGGRDPAPFQPGPM